MRRHILAATGLLVGAGAALGAPTSVPRRFPHVVVVTVDTLRADRLGAYGYPRPTTPALDRLLAAGVRFASARTVEPLTNPALVSLFTSLHPHEHGATRNGLAMRAGLPSLPQALRRRGYRTAAFVGNWTLKPRLSGLAEHFETYDVLHSRDRWFGLIKEEGTAEDISAAALAWLEEQRAAEPARPVLLWLHYVEPHAPYRLQRDFTRRLGLGGGELQRADRYDTEVAFVDQAIGAMLERVRRLLPPESTVVLFAADHGESLGEHGYWGHGRNLWEPTLRIPMGLVWPGRLMTRVVGEPALNLDLAPTVLGLLGLPPLPGQRGFDWSPVLRGEAPPPRDRSTCHQAHRGAVQSLQDAERARQRGLLEVGLLRGGRKEVLRLVSDHRWLFDLAQDRGEAASLVPSGSAASAELRACLALVQAGLVASDALPAPPTDSETLDGMRALGYIQ
jgi:arylsulfatase A-like enzyme